MQTHCSIEIITNHFDTQKELKKKKKKTKKNLENLKRCNEIINRYKGKKIETKRERIRKMINLPPYDL